MTRRRLARDALFQNVEGDFSVIVQSVFGFTDVGANVHTDEHERRGLDKPPRDRRLARAFRDVPFHFPVFRRLESRHAASRHVRGGASLSRIAPPPAGANISRRRWHPPDSSPRPPLIQQDKRKTVLALFHESREPWLLKDMEKAAAKKGVVFQAVKDVVQSLVDDSLVHVDKIGTSNWFWSFPGAADSALRARLEGLDAEKAKVDAECEAMDARLAAAEAERPQTEELQMAEVLLSSAREANAALLKEQESFATGDAAIKEAMREGTPVAREAANRWTDNVFMLKSWVEKKTSSREDTHAFFKSQAGINLDTFDYLEE